VRLHLKAKILKWGEYGGHKPYIFHSSHLAHLPHPAHIGATWAGSETSQATVPPPLNFNPLIVILLFKR